MGILLIVLMLVAGGTMIWAMQKHKRGVEWGKPVATLCALVGLGCAIGHMFLSGPESAKTVKSREAAFTKVAHEKLGLYLAEKHSGSRAVILHEPNVSKENYRHEATLEGLLKGFGTSVSVIETVGFVIPEPIKARYKEQAEGSGENLEDMIPMEEWYTAENMDKFIEQNRDASFIITTLGLPMDFSRMKYWQQKDYPKLVLTLGGNVYELKAAFKQGFILAAVSYNPQADFDKNMPDKDLNKAFDQRYILVTPENIDEVCTKFPGLFMDQGSAQ